MDQNSANPHKTLEQWTGARTGQPMQLAMLFTDIINSTKLCSEMGDRRWIEALIKHFKQARILLCDADCYEIKIIGDSFMVAFRHANDALNFATTFLRNTGDAHIKVRTGIHVGAARIIENDIYGGMVNYAARVTKWHKEEGIALSDSAKEQVENELGTKETRSMLTRVTHQFPDFVEPKILWRANLDALWNRRIRQDFPSLEELHVSGTDSSIVYRIERATTEDLIWIADIEIQAYESAAVPLEVMQAWYEKNPSGFFVMKSSDGTRVGHITLLPVREEPFQLLLRGEIKESELKPEVLYAPVEKRLVQDLYIESIIICPPEGKSRTPGIYALLSRFEELIADVCEPGNARNLYAIAATAAGERFMRPLGFQQAMGSRDRVDGLPFFAARYEDVVVNINGALGR